MLKLFPVVALLLCLSLPAAASPISIVDTGTPSGDDPWRLNDFEYFAAKFVTADTYNVQSVEGYFSHTLQMPGFIDIAIHAVDPYAENVLYHSVVEFAGETPLGWHGVTGVNWLLAPGEYWVSFKPTPPWMGSGVFGQMPGTAPSPMDAYLYSFTRDSRGIVLAPESPYYQWDDIEVDALGVRLQGVAVPDVTPTAPLLGLGFALIGLAAHRCRSWANVRRSHE